MTTKKRGLGRGLEALLVNVPNDAAQQSVIAQSLIDTLQQENRRLLEEARALQELLNEFDAMLRRYGNDS